MRTRKLGPLEVTVVGLGCNNFGGRLDEAGTRAVVDAALDAGVTFLDTADIYGNKGGSEELLGRALAGRRDRAVLATKFGKPMGDGSERRGSPDYIRSALEASLRRLQTDVVDLYQHHEEDEGTPLEETIGTLDELVRRGKDPRLRNVELPSRDARARAGAWLEAPLRLGAERVLLARPGRRGRAPPGLRAARAGLHPVLPARERAVDRQGHARSAAGGGLAPARPRDRRRRPRPRRAAALLGEAHGVSLLDVAIGGLAAVSPVVSVIAGATKPEQVRANAAAGAWEPSADELADLLQIDA